MARSIRPIIQKKANEMVQYNNENPSSTLAEIYALERKEGILEGEKKGIEQGLEQGKLEERKSIAHTLLSEKMSITSVASITKMTLEEVEALIIE